MPAGIPKRRLSESIFDNRLFWGAKSLIARKDRGSARQSARIAYLIWKIEIGRDWYRSQNGRDL